MQTLYMQMSECECTCRCLNVNAYAPGLAKLWYLQHRCAVRNASAKTVAVRSTDSYLLTPWGMSQTDLEVQSHSEQHVEVLVHCQSL